MSPLTTEGAIPTVILATKAYEEGRIGTVKNPRKAAATSVTYKLPIGSKTNKDATTTSRQIASVLIPTKCF